ncbi:MAG TPA: Asp-tRNA(Asn)/Glu-tRNA(Gln) amidotransferase subunit GatC [Thermoanaerobaculia bacterium]|nr:Asp-tRNA(Asn)/Glu-tRNA(Gln) amidotransferase subunit GatC [Thermoanaerobaculia bacterium]
MALNLDEVRKIASLARLRLSPEEERLFAGQLGDVVDYIDQLARYESADPPAAVALAPEADDIPGPSMPRELFLANAPSALDGFLLVPVVKGGGDA